MLGNMCDVLMVLQGLLSKAFHAADAKESPRTPRKFHIFSVDISLEYK